MSVDKDGKSANIDHLFDSGYCTNSGSNIDSIVKSEDTITVTDNDRLPPPESIPIPEEEEDLDAVSLLHLAISGRSSRVALQIMDLLPSPDYLDIRNELYQVCLLHMLFSIFLLMTHSSKISCELPSDFLVSRKKVETQFLIIAVSKLILIWNLSNPLVTVADTSSSRRTDRTSKDRSSVGPWRCNHRYQRPIWWHCIAHCMSKGKLRFGSITHYTTVHDWSRESNT